MLNDARIFKATKYIFVIIHNGNYKVTRGVKGYEGFDDIIEVQDDYQNVCKGWKQFKGYRMFDVRSKENAGREYFSELFSNLRQELLNNSTDGEKTLLWFYYAGHGVMKNLVFAVTTDGTAPYPLEAQLMNLSTTKNCYVLGTFDCCRAPFPTTHRGANAEENLEETTSPYNFIFYYGCPPNKTVPGKSTLAKAFFAKLNEKADPYYGSVVLPSSISHWHGTDGQANSNSNANTDLLLQFADWQPKAGAKPQHVMQMMMDSPAEGAEGFDYGEQKYYTVQKLRNMFSNAAQ